MNGLRFHSDSFDGYNPGVLNHLSHYMSPHARVVTTYLSEYTDPVLSSGDYNSINEHQVALNKK